MKVWLIVPVFLIVLFPVKIVQAQQFEISPFTGYTFPSSFDITGGSARLEGNANWGTHIGYTTVGKRTEFEFSYTYFGTDASASSVYLVDEVISRARFHFFMLGTNRLLKASDKLTYFWGGKIGASNLDFPDGENPGRTRFTVGIQTGVRYYLSDRFGLRIQGNLLLPILSEGGSLWWNPSSGTGISGWSAIVPLSLNAGVVFRIWGP